MTLEQQRERFWNELLALSNEQTSLFREFFGNPKNYYLDAPSGEGGIRFRYTIWSKKPQAQVTLHIDLGSAERNTHALHTLQSDAAAIHQEFGDTLIWQFPTPHARQAYVCSPIRCGGLKEEAHWPEIQQAMVDRMVRLEMVFKPRIHGISRSDAEWVIEQQWEQSFADSADALAQLADEALDYQYAT